MGSVSTTAGFIDMAQIGSNGKVTNSTKQGLVVLTRDAIPIVLTLFL